MESAKKALGVRLRTARHKLGLKQKEVADKAGFPAHQIISQIEAGKRDVKAWELATLTKVLKINVVDLFAEEIPKEAPMLWREDPGDLAMEAEQSFRRRCDEYWMIEQACGIKARPKLPEYGKYVTEMTFEDAEQLAHEASKVMDLGARPASSLVHVLENKYQVKIWYADLDDGSAVTTWGDFGPAILMNANQAPWRRNYNFAHELFHLLTWDSNEAEHWKEDEETWENIEKLANSFASHLLLPADELDNELTDQVEENQLTYASLVEVARNFGVSTSALIWRMVSLRWITREEAESALASEEFRTIDRQSMPGLWDNPEKLPERFVRFAFSAYMRGNLSRTRLAELMETSLFDLNDKLREYGLDEEADYEASITVT